MGVDDYINIIHHLCDCLYDECLKFVLIGVSEVALVDKEKGGLTAAELEVINDMVSKYEYQDKEKGY